MSPKIEINIPLELKQELEAYAKFEDQTTNEFIIMAVSEKVGELRQRKGVRNLTALQPGGMPATDQPSRPIDPPIYQQRGKLLLAGEVAKLLQVSRSKAYSLIRSGELPSIHIGTSVRVPEDDLKAYIQKQKGDCN